MKPWIVTALLLAGLASAHAGDRPFSALVTAAAEEDDDRVWSIDTTVERLGSVRAFGAQAEYAFDPVNSVQFGYGRARERGTGATAQAVDFEVKHLFNRIARDGWGWGLSLEHAFVKAAGEGWRGGHWTLTLPFSLQLGESGALLHANLGRTKSRGEPSERVVAIGAEAPVLRHAVLFGEVAREGEETLVNVGVRHWIRKERFAVDISLQRVRGDGERSNGFVIGLSWYDL